MRTRHRLEMFALAAGGAALAVSLLLNAALYLAYRRLAREAMIQDPTLEVVSDPALLLRKAYGNPDRWLWRPEARGIARQRAVMRPKNTRGISEFLAGMREDTKAMATPAKVEALLRAYLAHRRNWAEAYYPVLAPGGLYCDENVAIFRNILLRMGIPSRVVVFQFGDGDGGASHTAMEVWVPETNSWAYADPYYGALDDRSIWDIATTTRYPRRVLMPAHAPALREVFAAGPRELFYENHAPRARLVYRAPQDGAAPLVLPPR